MTATTAALIAGLVWLATVAGSGMASYKLLDLIRKTWPLPATEPANAGARLAYMLIYAPRYARYSAIVLAILISMTAQAALAAMQGASILAAIDEPAAHALAFLISQIAHGQKLPTQPAGKLRMRFTMPVRAAIRRRPVATLMPTEQANQEIAAWRAKQADSLAELAELATPAPAGAGAPRQPLQIAAAAFTTPRIERARPIFEYVSWSSYPPTFKPGLIAAEHEGEANSRLADLVIQRDGRLTSIDRQAQEGRDRIDAAQRTHKRTIDQRVDQEIENLIGEFGSAAGDELEQDERERYDDQS